MCIQERIHFISFTVQGHCQRVDMANQITWCKTIIYRIHSIQMSYTKSYSLNCKINYQAVVRSNSRYEISLFALNLQLKHSMQTKYCKSILYALKFLPYGHHFITKTNNTNYCSTNGIQNPY